MRIVGRGQANTDNGNVQEKPAQMFTKILSCSPNVVNNLILSKNGK